MHQFMRSLLAPTRAQNLSAFTHILDSEMRKQALKACTIGLGRIHFMAKTHSRLLDRISVTSRASGIDGSHGITDTLKPLLDNRNCTLDH